MYTVLLSIAAAKVAALTSSWMTSPTNYRLRNAYLDHVDHVVEALDKAGIGIGPKDRETLEHNLRVLRDSAEKGWISPPDTSAFVQVLLFLSWAHAKGTEFGVSAALSAHTKALGDFVWNFGAKVLNAIAPQRK
jgi:hypothetical protein